MNSNSNKPSRKRQEGVLYDISRETDAKLKEPRPELRTSQEEVKPTPEIDEIRNLRFPKSAISVGILLIFSIFLSFKNYTPGTWLIGWDNIMAEFNFALNIKRSLFAVWQEYQGVGLLGGMGHASDLPRQLFLLFLSVFFHNNFLRYFYQFLMLVLGPIGVYLLIKRVFLFKVPERGREISALLGGLFYLLNLATLQTFFIPASMFTTQYGFLPFLLLYCLLYLREHKRRYLNLFALFSIFSLPMAYTPTLFMAYLSVLFIVFLVYIITNRNSGSLKRILKVIFVIFVINAYWLLPFMYFSFNKSHDLINAKINRFASEDGFLRNKEYGTFRDISILRGFWFEFVEMQPNGKFDYLMPTWRNHLDASYIEELGYLIFVVILLGIIQAVYKKRPFSKTFLFVFAFAIFMLLNENPPLGFVFKFLRDHFTQFREALRFPFTKFSIIASLTYALFFSSGIYVAHSHLERVFKRLTNVVVLTIFSTILIIFMAPAFQGRLISPRMRIQIPQEYFDLFEFFSQQDSNTRIANFPQHTFWGWNYYNWGYIGSGFLWYGIEQPILDRAFDVWSSANEAYYEEMAYAIYSQDLQTFENLLDKYQIDYLLLDKNLVSPTEQRVLFYSQLEDLFSRSERVEFVDEFKDLKVYKTKLSYNVSDFIYSKKAKNIMPEYKKAFYDKAFASEGVYFTSSKDIDQFYPFRTFSYQPGVDRSTTKGGVEGWVIIEDNSKLGLKGVIPATIKVGTLELPPYAELEDHIPVMLVLAGDVLRLIYKTPTVFINGGTVTRSNSDEIKLSVSPEEILGWGLNGSYLGKSDQVTLATKKNNILKIYSSKEVFSRNISRELFSQNVQQCDDRDADQYYAKNINGDALEITAKNTIACVFVNLASVLIDSDKPELIKVSFDYKPARDEKPFFCLYSPNKNDCLNIMHPSQFYSENGWQKYEEYLDIAELDLDNSWFQLLLDAESSEENKSISYKNITVTTYPVIYQTVITKEHVQSQVGGKIGFLTKGLTELLVDLDKYLEDFSSRIQGDGENCDNFNSSFFSKDILEDEKGAKILRYTSEDATSCDHFEYLKFPHDRTSLLLIESRNIYGRPLSICLENLSSGRCDLHEFLSDSRKWEKNYFIIPQTEDVDLGDVLHVYNRSVGRERVVNELRDIRFYDVPLDYLKDIKVFVDPSVEETSVKELEVIKTSKLVPFLYRVDIESSNEGMLVLNQAYGSGWVLLSGSQLFGKHVLVNNWANGWIVPPGKRSAILFYVPQSLEFVGFGLFSITLLLNLTFRKKSVI